MLTARVGKDAPLRGGFRVVTTLDLGLQRQAELALKNAVTASSWRRVRSGALVAVDPRSGELMAMVGSVDRNAPGGSFNMAVAPRNPGTTFRAFTYTAAIASKRYTMITPLPNVPIAIELLTGSVPQTYKPMNWTAGSTGRASSRPAWVTCSILRPYRQSWAPAYARWSGWRGTWARHLDAGAAFIVSQMLADDLNRAMIFGRGSPLALPGRHAAALTGRTDDYRDAWAAGYTPSLAASVWMGNASNEPLVSRSDAISVAAPAWHQFMQTALDQMGKGDEWYTPPDGVDSSEVNGRQAYFLPGTSASTPAPALPGSVHLGVAGAGQ